MIQLIDYLKERLAAAKFVLFFIMFAIFVWSLTVDTSHAHTWAEKYIPGFWSFFGIVSCVVLIYVARWYAGSGISKEENYYDN